MRNTDPKSHTLVRTFLYKNFRFPATCSVESGWRAAKEIFTIGRAKGDPILSYALPPKFLYPIAEDTMGNGIFEFITGPFNLRRRTQVRYTHSIRRAR
jgi:hypothetical protein